jgi:FkbM family methyltransferase
MTTQAYRDWVRDRGDETLRLNYNISPNDIVFDAGGYVGDFASRLHNLYKCKVHVFEPVPRFIDVIKERFYAEDSIILHEYGLGNENKVLHFNDAADATQLVESGGSEGVAVKDIKEVMESLDNPEIALFKINIEGGEYDLLDRLIETGLVANCKNLQIQFHDFYPDAISRRDRIVEKLRDTHNLMYEYPFIWEGWQKKC